MREKSMPKINSEMGDADVRQGFHTLVSCVQLGGWLPRHPKKAILEFPSWKSVLLMVVSFEQDNVNKCNLP